MKKTVLVWICGILVLALSGCMTSEKRTQQGEVHYLLGVSYLREGNPTLALKEFLIAADADPRNPEIQDALGQAYHLKKAYSDAEQHYLRAIRLSKKAPQYQNNLAALYLDMRRWDEAIHYFRQAASNLLFLNPEVAYSGIANAYYQKGDFLQAIQFNQEALKQNPRYLRAHMQLGENYLALDKNGLAVEEFQQVVKAAPDMSMAHFKLGFAYLKLRENKKASASFLEVVRLATDPELVRQAGDYLKLLQ